MKPFVAVVGDKDSGKSTIIQSLTGCRTHSFVWESFGVTYGNLSGSDLIIDF